MALKTFKCYCGIEFEDSEFIVMDECEECRANEPPPTTTYLPFNIDNTIQHMTYDILRINTDRYDEQIRRAINYVLTGTNMRMPIPPGYGYQTATMNINGTTNAANQRPTPNDDEPF